MHESFTPSTFGEKWSMIRMCTAKQKAQIRMMMSPPLTCPNPSGGMQSRYSPTADAMTQAHMIGVTRFFRKMPISGTMTTYSAVIKPV